MIDSTAIGGGGRGGNGGGKEDKDYGRSNETGGESGDSNNSNNNSKIGNHQLDSVRMKLNSDPGSNSSGSSSVLSSNNNNSNIISPPNSTTTNHHPRAPSSVKSKTIKPPGSNTTRVSVACDRCRKKKIRCFYDNDDPDDESGRRQCANCKVVGLECIFTDKLARKAFPRGYTESLEERVRELEYENKKLQKLLSLKNTDDNSLISHISTENTQTTVEMSLAKTKIKQESNPDFDMMNSSQRSTVNANANDDNTTNNGNNDSDANTDIEMHNNINNGGDTSNVTGDDTRNTNSTTRSDFGSPSHVLNTENVSRLDVDFKPNLHTHDENCNCGMHHSVINRPVSIAGSVDIDHGDLSDDESLNSNDSHYSRQNSAFSQLGHAFSSNQNHLNGIISPHNADFNPGSNSNFNFSNNLHISNIDHLKNDGNAYGNEFGGNNDLDGKNRFVYNPNSFEQINAPGAAAAISLQNKLRTKNFLNLANLIAASIPRSTEETLFIPTLLARIIKTHGFDSKAPYLTARSIALLKQAYNEEERYNLFPITFKGVNFNDLNKSESKAFFQSLNLPNNMNLDICITIFFNTWNTIIPVMNKEIFMANYKKFIKSRELNYEDGELVGFEKFGELLVIITCLVMISNERSNIAAKFSNSTILESTISPSASNPNSNANNSYSNSSENENTEKPDKPNTNKVSSNGEILQFYDHIIKQLIQSNMSSICSISSLQIITIELLYCLATDELTTSYELRGRMITMCQQLRLHRCPAAVLGSNGSSVSKLQQGERRILFWCIYTLDSFSAFILGVPRLLKDYEIECALPSSSSSDKENKDSDISLITFQNNVQLSLVGKVCDSALSIMRYSKILGTIVDSIFRRSEGLKQTNINESKCLIMEDLLETWRRNLPSNVSFNSVHNSKDINVIDNLNETQLTLYYLYYQAKALIYMPLLASESTFNLTSSKCSPAFISIQQATTSILTTMKVLNTSKHNYYFLPLPINIARQMARFSLLAARNSLEYTRGGSLFQEAKLLLNSIINELKIENKIGLLGCLSNNCVSCLEHAIDAILSQPKSSGFNNLDPIESVKKESKKKNLGSPLKKVSNIESFTKKPPPTVSVKSEEMDVDLEENQNIKGRTPNNSSDRRKIAINDIFSNNENKNSHQRRNSVNPQSERRIISNDKYQSSNVSNTTSNAIANTGTDDLFNFMSADPKAMEEESLNMILKNVDGDEGLNNSPELLLEKQKLLIQQKQQFLQTQQENLQRQIQLLQHQAKSKAVTEAEAQLQRQQAEAGKSQQDKDAASSSNSNILYLQQPMESPVQIDNTQVKDTPFSVKSFSDLLMFNDFGVDASLGLPLIDFELDTTQTKKQKIDPSNLQDFEELYGYSNSDINHGNVDSGGYQLQPSAMTFEESPDYNPYGNSNNNNHALNSTNLSPHPNQFRHGHEHQHRANFSAAKGFDEGTANGNAKANANANVNERNSDNSVSLFDWNLNG